MDEHKTQQPEPEIVPARRKSGRMRSWKASILACVICILVTALADRLDMNFFNGNLVTWYSLIFYRESGENSVQG